MAWIILDPINMILENTRFVDVLDPSAQPLGGENEVASHEAVGLPFEFWSAEEIQKRLAFDLQSYGPQAGTKFGQLMFP